MQPVNQDPQDVRIRRELSMLLDERAETQRRLAALESAVNTPTQSVPGAGDNILLNCEAEWSDDAYNDTGLGGDVAERLAYWYQHADTDTLLSLIPDNLLKAPTNSTYAADDPDWEKTAGRMRLGTKRTISQRLPNRYAQAGAILYFQFTATLRTVTALPANLLFYFGIWDNTAGQEKWLSGSTLAITLSIVGTPGATTRQYRVIVTTDKGEQYQIDAAAIANAPNTPSVDNYVHLSWPVIAGRVRTDIYKLEGGVYHQLTDPTKGIVSGVSEWNDYGDSGTIVGGFPTASLTARRARVQDNVFAPQYGTITRYSYALTVPSDYDISLTTGDQVLRMGLSQNLTDAHQLILDRFQLGFNWGGFQRSASDLAIQNTVSVTTSPTGGLLSPPTYDPYDPPDTGSGGPRREYTIL